MNTLNKSLHNLPAIVALALVVAGCGAAVQTGTDGDRAIGESFESEDYFVVIAKSGDTAASLATRLLGDAAKAWMIEDFNAVSTISPGKQVVIPKRYWNLSGVSADGYQWCRYSATTTSRRNRRGG